MASMVNVQFSDSSETTIASFFGCQQPAEAYPNQAQIQSTDPRWAAFYVAQPGDAQAALPSPGS